jgi:lysophospholipase L1-like esterase
MTRSGPKGPNAVRFDAARRPIVRVIATMSLIVGCPAASPAVAVNGGIVPAQCAAPEGTAFVDGPLPRLARRLKGAGPATIVVIGSGSAAGVGTSRTESAFPYRLESRLASAFPKARLRFVVLAETGQTAPAMHARLPRDVIPLRPALVVWQTGSADAARGVPVTDFGAALDQGIVELRDAGSDVLLVDSQFGPRASLLINTDAYRESVRWNARRFELPLFKRYDTMQFWWSNEVFDLDAQDKATQMVTADRVHDCVAAQIVQLIERGVAARSAQ